MYFAYHRHVQRSMSNDTTQSRIVRKQCQFVFDISTKMRTRWCVVNVFLILFVLGVVELKLVFFSDTMAPYDMAISNSEYPYGYKGNSSGNVTDYGYYRVRYLKGCTINANITIDIKLTIELPSDEGFNGTIEFDIPITISIVNKTLFKIPLPDKPLKVPIFYPVIELPARRKKNYPKKYNPPPSPPPAYVDYDPEDPYFDYLDRTTHYLAKRSLAANSAVHRSEIFQSIENALDR